MTISAFFKGAGILTASAAIWLSGYVAGNNNLPGAKGTENKLSFEATAALLGVVGAAAGFILWKIGACCESDSHDDDGRPLLPSLP